MKQSKDFCRDWCEKNDGNKKLIRIKYFFNIMFFLMFVVLCTFWNFYPLKLQVFCFSSEFSKNEGLGFGFDLFS